MLCLKPYRQGVMEYGCGQCLPCRIGRRRVWTGRLVLEASQHQACCFVTLTYDDEHLPKDGSISKRDVQLFLKRLRERVGQFRYFIVGEYGEQNSRPHYHGVFFGIAGGPAFAASWNLGFVYVGSFTAASAAYTAGYCLKGMTKLDDPRLKGRVPERAWMSLCPGIGGLAVDPLVRVNTSVGGVKHIAETGDITGTLRVDGRMWPIGRYVRGKVREAIRGSAKVPERARVAVANRMLDELSLGGREDRRRQSGWRAKRLDELSRVKKGL